MTSIRNRKHAVNPYALLLGSAALIASPAFAQDTRPADSDTPPPHHHHHAHGPRADGVDRDDDSPTEVTVKGEKAPMLKRTASLVDTPQTIEVIKHELIAQQGATTLTEALRNTPGVGTFYLGENGSTSTGDALYMRGSDVSGSIFVDGVRDVATISRDMFNIEAVEVLKGGAGADIGRGAATGAINLQSKRPLLDNLYTGTAAVGGGDYYRATADLNWRLGESRALRLNLMDQDAGVAGRDIVKNKRWGIAPTLAFGINTPTSLQLGWQHVEQKNIPDGGVFTIGLPGYTSPDGGGLRSFLNSAAKVDSKNFYGTRDDHDNVTSDIATVMVEHDFGNGLHLSNTTRWGQTDENYQLMSVMGQAATSTRPLLTPDPNNPATWTLTRLVNNRDTTNKTLVNQTNLSGHFDTGFIRHSFNAGAEFSREELISRAFGATGAYPAASVYNPDPNVGGYSRFLTGAYTDGVTDTQAAYASDTMTLSPQWLVNAGLRYDNYKTDYRSIAANGSNAAAPLTAKGDLWSGLFGVVYKPVRSASVYASYAETAQPPGGANFTLSSTAGNTSNPDIKPQIARNWELGTKWDLAHGHLSLTGALYRTQYSDTVTQDTDGTYYHSGSKSAEGIELGASGHITRDWTINAGYMINHTKVKNAAAVTSDGSTDLAYSPTDAFTLWTAYKIHEGPLRGLTLAGGPRYNGEMKRGKDGAVGTPAYTKAYWVADGMASYPLTRHIDAQLNIYNLFDTDYVASINKSGYRYTPGTPRTVRLTLNVKY